MKLITTAIISLVALVSLAAGGTSIFGDITIESNDKNGNFYCDGLICPEKTHSCEVIKHNDPNDFQQLIRVRKCLDGDGKILQDQVVREPNRYQGNVNIQVSSGGGVSRKLTPEEERQLRLYLEDVQRRIAEEIDQNMSQLNEQLRPFQDGSFAVNLQNRIGADWDNSDFNERMRPFLDGSFGTNLRNQINNEVRENLRGIFH